MAESWIKLHTDLLYDAKVRRLEPEHRYAWVGLLLLAKVGDPEGSWKASAPDRIAEDLCACLRFDAFADDTTVGSMGVALELMESLGMVTIDVTQGRVTVTNWSRRQGVTVTQEKRDRARDMARERQRKLRGLRRMSRRVTPVTPIEEKRAEEIRGDDREPRARDAAEGHQDSPHPAPGPEWPEGEASPEAHPLHRPTPGTPACPDCTALLRVLADAGVVFASLGPMVAAWVHEAHSVRGLAVALRVARQRVSECLGSGKRRFLAPRHLFEPGSWAIAMNSLDDEPPRRSLAALLGEV